METFNITDEEIINCIVDCACNMSGDEMLRTIKILIDFMQFKNNVLNTNIIKIETTKLKTNKEK